MDDPAKIAREEDPLNQLRSVLTNLSDEQLASIGVTLERDDGDWEWLKDAFVNALENEGRWRAAKVLRSIDLRTSPQYSIGLSRSFLVSLNAIIRAELLKGQTNEQ